MTGPGRRLSSWKEIAAYLQRDVRTVTRWEKERGLPVHRGPGRRGVVYADTDELEAWLKGAAPEPVTPLDPAPLARPASRIGRSWIVAAATVVAVVAAASVWRVSGMRSDAVADAVLAGDAVIARRADGTEKWRYTFTAGRPEPPFNRSDRPIEVLGRDGLVVGVSGLLGTGGASVSGGRLLWLENDGRIRHAFAFDDTRTFGLRPFSGPWAINDYQVQSTSSGRQLAVAAHHYDWWPSLVAVLDREWTRRGTFVNAGWIDRVAWIGEDRLLLSGFSNARDGGMVGLLDAAHMDGQSPPSGDAEFACANCGADRPLRYLVLPRSEVNRVAAAPFNRAATSIRGDRLLVTTTETPGSATVTAATAIYEFTTTLELLYAAYSDRYWDAHRELEMAGKIDHSRQECPERDGPRQIEVWEPGRGWRMQPVHPLRP